MHNTIGASHPVLHLSYVHPTAKSDSFPSLIFYLLRIAVYLVF